jgi:hypothetical protein
MDPLDPNSILSSGGLKAFSEAVAELHSPDALGLHRLRAMNQIPAMTPMAS